MKAEVNKIVSTVHKHYIPKTKRPVTYKPILAIDSQGSLILFNPKEF